MCHDAETPCSIMPEEEVIYWNLQWDIFWMGEFLCTLGKNYSASIGIPSSCCKLDLLKYTVPGIEQTHQRKGGSRGFFPVYPAWFISSWLTALPPPANIYYVQPGHIPKATNLRLLKDCSMYHLYLIILRTQVNALSDTTPSLGDLTNRWFRSWGSWWKMPSLILEIIVLICVFSCMCFYFCCGITSNASGQPPKKPPPC